MISPALTFGVLLACQSPGSDQTDGERFAMAADAGSSASEALAGCQGMAEVESRGDCLSLALSTHKVSSRAACELIESERWSGECYFLLAESQRGEDLAQATRTCSLSSYARECMEHLIRSEASIALEKSPIELEDRVAILEGSPVATDAGVIFWQEWATLRVAADRMVTRSDCARLEDKESCTVGMNRARKKLVRDAGLQNRCEAFAEGRALLVLSDGRAVLNTGVPASVGNGVCPK